MLWGFGRKDNALKALVVGFPWAARITKGEASPLSTPLGKFVVSTGGGVVWIDSERRPCDGKTRGVIDAVNRHAALGPYDDLVVCIGHRKAFAQAEIVKCAIAIDATVIPVVGVGADD